MLKFFSSIWNRSKIARIQSDIEYISESIESNLEQIVYLQEAAVQASLATKDWIYRSVDQIKTNNAQLHLKRLDLKLRLIRI